MSYKLNKRTIMQQSIQAVPAARTVSSYGIDLLCLSIKARSGEIVSTHFWKYELTRDRLVFGDTNALPISRFANTECQISTL